MREKKVEKIGLIIIKEPIFDGDPPKKNKKKIIIF